MSEHSEQETGWLRGVGDAASAAEASVCLTFDGGRIEPSRNLVRLAGEPISLEPRTMEVLVYLATHAGHVVSKAELLGNVWEGRWVAEDALSVYIYELRKALGDDARQPRFVETVRKRGYRWMPPIQVRPLPLAVQAVSDADIDPRDLVVEGSVQRQLLLCMTTIRTVHGCRSGGLRHRSGFGCVAARRLVGRDRLFALR
ncbi:MAG: transcriptional regulator [Thermoanaerobaculia bacterium]|nr:transcriptional regulator [Thermoanaerobaculia bacterium]